MAKLEVHNLKISFRTNRGALRAVRNISFNLNEGETLAIVGESGSGKSVSARAVMGILAGNAIVEGGTIIYDGKDLLKISEDDFHTLRGHKLAMVFQDPLSALNPIMRIGKQLTEAMILNNKERRADGKARFEDMVKRLEKNMQLAGCLDATEQIKLFRAIVDKSVVLEKAYEDAKESIVESTDYIDEIIAARAKGGKNPGKEAMKSLRKSMKRVANEYLHLSQADASAMLSELESSFEANSASVKEKLESYLEGTKPDFFSIGYAVVRNANIAPSAAATESINDTLSKKVREEFLDGFIANTAKALEYSHEQSMIVKKSTIGALREALPVYEKSTPVEQDCKAAAKKCSAAVNAAIDRLELEKDNQSYIFTTSINTAIERYFRGLKQNPQEEARFRKDTKKHDAMVKRGKVTNGVVPMNLVDIDEAHENMISTVSNLIALYEMQVAGDSAINCTDKAVAVVDYLKARASEYAYNLSMAMAKHRAIELMEEVGIPEPRKRYHQYSFELSGGMRQRIVIAIALSANPDILICDEPTTALDVTIQAQILELINRLKKQRNLSVIFITHDLGVVANMADRIAVMYAGKVVEYGTSDEVFYEPAHPYTWALLSSMPDLQTKEKLEAIPGTPPDMIFPPVGDAFAARNRYALKIDFEQQPPEFAISDTHWAATWLRHPDAPAVQPPAIVRERIDRMKKLQQKEEETA